jgi:hypothetical protein
MKTFRFFQIFIASALLTIPFYVTAQKSVAQSESMRFLAQISQDTAALHRLLADDLVYIHSNALVETKTDFIRSVGGGGIRYLAMQKTETGPIRQWEKTAVAIGIVDVRGLYQGKEFEMRLRYTSVYRKLKGIWQLSSWQSTRLP